MARYWFCLLFPLHRVRPPTCLRVALSDFHAMRCSQLCHYGRFCLQHQEGLSESEGTNTPRRSRSCESTAKLRMEFDRRRLKWLWLGAGLYSLIFLNGIRLGCALRSELPLLAILLVEVLNGSILAVFVLEISKLYHRLES